MCWRKRVRNVVIYTFFWFYLKINTILLYYLYDEEREEAFKKLDFTLERGCRRIVLFGARYSLFFIFLKQAKKKVFFLVFNWCVAAHESEIFSKRIKSFSPLDWHVSLQITLKYVKIRFTPSHRFAIITRICMKIKMKCPCIWWYSFQIKATAIVREYYGYKSKRSNSTK